jgi:hypothetical protein
VWGRIFLATPKSLVSLAGSLLFGIGDFSTKAAGTAFVWLKPGSVTRKLL